MVEPIIDMPRIDEIGPGDLDDENFRLLGWPRTKDPRIRRRIVDWLEDWWSRYGDKKTFVPATQIDGERIPELPTCLLGCQLSPDAMRALIALKGWTVVDLASRWGLSSATLSRAISDPCRPLRIDDMVWGIAPYEEPATDWWRRRLLQLSAGHYSRQAAYRRSFRRAKASSFTRYEGRPPGRLVWSKSSNSDCE